MKQKRKSVLVNFPPEIVKKVDAIAKRNRTSRNYTIVRLLEIYLNKEESGKWI